MARDVDDDRIRLKAHELWEADGRPHGRDADHWVQAREIIAIQDSQGDALLPRDFGAEEPIEHADQSLRNLADFPNLTGQGENLLTSTDREPGAVPGIEVSISDQPGIAAKPSKSPRGPEVASAPTKQKQASAEGSLPAQPKKTTVPKPPAAVTAKGSTTRNAPAPARK